MATKKELPKEVLRIRDLKFREQVRIELLSAYAPYLAPLIPAVLTYLDLTSFLSLGEEIPVFLRHGFGIVAGLTVEFLGLASGHTLASFQAHNKANAAKKNQVPIWPILFTFGMYLAIVLSLNVILPWSHITPTEAFTRAALSLMTVPSIIIISTRAMHANILLRKEEFQALKESNTSLPGTPPPPERPKESTVLNVDAMPRIKAWLTENKLTPMDVGKGKRVTPSQLATHLKLNPTSVRTAIFRLKKENQNGDTT